MILTSIHRAHWLLISLVVGLTLGYTLRLTPEDFISYGTSLNNPVEFEAALTDPIGDDRRFKDLIVTRCRIPHGDEVDFVSGLYCSGQVDPKDNAYHWKPTFFVAPVPYRSATESPRINQLHNPTVRDLLAILHVPYTYAWWRVHSMAVSLTASVILIGVIWPTLIMLIVYGRWTRPPQEKGFNLWLVKPAPAREHPAAAYMPAAEKNAEESNVAPPQSPPPQMAIAPLPNEPLQPVAASATAHTEFGADPDDFYPTEQKAHRH